MNLLTPKSILTQKDFPAAQMIFPDYFPTFDSLFEVREDIRDLKILPIKTNSMREFYKRAHKGKLLGELELWMKDKNILLLPNSFPYFLPPDLKQEILWVKDDVSDEEILNSIPYEEVICFERPKDISTNLVKGTFSLMRHIHIWTRK